MLKKNKSKKLKEKDTNIINDLTVLPNSEAVKIAKAFRDLRKEKLSREDFEAVVKSCGLSLKNYSYIGLNEYKLMSDVERIRKNGYYAKEIRNCILLSEDYGEIFVNGGRVSMEILAKNGDAEAQRILDTIDRRYPSKNSLEEKEM